MARVSTGPSAPSRRRRPAHATTAHRRLEHMDEFGVLAQVLYPNIGVFQVNEYIGMKADPQLVLECVQAYNDFLVDFSSVAPDRYVPLMTVPFWNLEAAHHRTAPRPRHRPQGSGVPGADGGLQPAAAVDPHWDPFWSEVQEMDLSINFHIGSGNIPMFGTDNSGKHLNYAWTGSMLFFLNANAITSLIFGGVCQRFPSAQVRVRRERRGVGPVPARGNGLAVPQLGRAHRTPRARVAAERVLRPPDLQLLLVRASIGARGHRATRRRPCDVRDRLPSFDRHHARAGQRRARATRPSAHRARRDVRRRHPQGAPRQRRRALSPRRSWPSSPEPRRSRPWSPSTSS